MEDRKTFTAIVLFICGIILLTILAMPFFARGIISFFHLILLKPIGALSSWIGYYGSIFGCMAGGAISAYVAYFIAKKQIDAQNELNKADRKIRIRNDIEIETAKLILPSCWLIQQTMYKNYLFLRNLVKCCNANNSYFISNKIDNDYSLFEGHEIHENYLNELKNFFQKNMEDWSYSKQELYKHQNEFLELRLSRRMVLKNFFHTLDGIIKANSEINSYLLKIEKDLIQVQKSFNGEEKVERSDIEKIIVYCNENYIKKCSDALYQLIKVSNDIQNTFYSGIFGGAIIYDEINEIENKFKPLNLEEF